MQKIVTARSCLNLITDMSVVPCSVGGTSTLLLNMLNMVYTMLEVLKFMLILRC